MPEVSVNKRHLSLPWTVAVSAVIGIASGSGVYYSLVGRVDAANAQGASWESTSRERFGAVERRVERLEETSQRTLIVLERIDERTAEMKRRLDATPTR